MKFFNKDYREYKKKIKEEAKNSGLNKIDDILSKFNGVVIAIRDVDGATFSHQTICYIYNKDGINYAIDINDYNKYYVSESDGFYLSDDDKKNIRYGDYFSYQKEKIDFDYYSNIKKYDLKGQRGLTYSANELDKIIKDIKCFIVATDGLNINKIELVAKNPNKRNIDQDLTFEDDSLKEVYENVRIAKLVSVYYIEFISDKNIGRKRKTRFNLECDYLPVTIERIDGIDYGVSLFNPDDKYEILRYYNNQLTDEQYIRVGNNSKEFYIHDIDQLYYLNKDNIDEIAKKYYENKEKTKELIRKK